jgi:hypothetical protein
MKRLLMIVAILFVMVSGSYAQRFTSPFNPRINANSPYWPYSGDYSWDIHSPNWIPSKPAQGNYGDVGGYNPYYTPYYNQHPGIVVPSQ